MLHRSWELPHTNKAVSSEVTDPIIPICIHRDAFPLMIDPKAVLGSAQTRFFWAKDTMEPTISPTPHGSAHKTPLLGIGLGAAVGDSFHFVHWPRGLLADHSRTSFAADHFQLQVQVPTSLSPCIGTNTMSNHSNEYTPMTCKHYIKTILHTHDLQIIVHIYDVPTQWLSTTQPWPAKVTKLSLNASAPRGTWKQITLGYGFMYSSNMNVSYFLHLLLVHTNQNRFKYTKRIKCLQSQASHFQCRSKLLNYMRQLRNRLQSTSIYKHFKDFTWKFCNSGSLLDKGIVRSE